MPSCSPSGSPTVLLSSNAAVVWRWLVSAQGLGLSFRIAQLTRTYSGVTGGHTSATVPGPFRYTVSKASLLFAE